MGTKSFEWKKRNVNIDEDCIQALLDNGANSVILYTVGKTVQRN